MNNDFSTIKLIDANLQQYALATMKSEFSIHKEIALKDFFGNNDYCSVMSMTIGFYQHKKMQAIWDDFLQKNNWRMLFDCREFNRDSPPLLESMEIAPKRHKKIYRSACVFLGNTNTENAAENNHKICFEIEMGPKNTYIYTFYGARQYSDLLDKLIEFANIHNIFRGQKIDCDGKFLNLEDISWDDIVLPNGTKEVIISNIDQMFAMRDDFEKFGISVKRGVILYGEPGTGKTRICKCLAKDAKYSVLYAMPSDFMHMNGIKYVCDMAQDLAPCLLIIEDIDWIAQDRSKGNAPFVMELMNKIDGLESFGDIITLGTTNCLEELEDAIKNRPGRFDRLINIGLPDKECIGKMIRTFTSNFVIAEDSDLARLAECCEKLTGAHIKDLCNTAAIYAVKDKSMQGEKLLLKKSHFDDAIKEIKNKNYSSYLKMQSSKKNFGFVNRVDANVLDYLDLNNDSNDGYM